MRTSKLFTCFEKKATVVIERFFENNGDVCVFLFFMIACLLYRNLKNQKHKI